MNQRVVSPPYITITDRCCKQIMLGNNKNKKIYYVHYLIPAKEFNLTISYGDSQGYHLILKKFLNIFNTNIK